LAAGPVFAATRHAAVASDPCHPAEPEVGDLDGDGAPDLAVGLPWPNNRSVDVHYTDLGQAHYAGSLFAGVNPYSDFGYAAASIGVDAKGCSDLIVGAPHLSFPPTQGVPPPDLGSVTLLEGSRAGLAANSVRTVLISGVAGDGFGSAVAASARGYGTQPPGPPLVDLWVGAPDRTVNGQLQAGAVDHYVLDQAGTDTLIQTITAASAGVGAPVRAGAHFGQVLSANEDSVLIGAPGDTVAGHAGAGSVQLVTINDTTGLLSSGHFWTQASTGVPGAPETGAGFGAAVWDNGSLAAVGVPGEDLGRIVDAGMVQLFRANTLDFATASFWKSLDQDSPGIPGSPNAAGRFGASLAMGKKLYCDWTNDLAIGAPGGDVGQVLGAGSVTLVALSLDGSVAPTQPICPARVLTQGSGGLGGVVEKWDHVGQSLSILRAEDTPDFEDPNDTLVVGIPYEDVGNTVNAGIVTSYNFYSTAKTYGYSSGSTTNLRYGLILTQPGGGTMELP
jgi:hypothetical protein